MRVHVLWKGCKPTEGQRALWRREMAQLRRLLRGIDVSSAHLRAGIEFYPKRKRYEITLRMNMPQFVAVAREEGHDLASALETAFDELKGQLRRYRDLHRKAHALRRRRRLPARPVWEPALEQIPEGLSAEARQLIEALWPRLERWVRHELAIKAAQNGMPDPSVLDPRDIVQNGLLKALAGLELRPEHVSLRAWLVRHVWQAMEEAFRDLVQQSEREEVHLEMDVPEIEPELAATAAAEERYAFLHPEEDWTLADIVADPQAIDPELHTEVRDLLRIVLQALERMPERWRRLFTLRHVYGLGDEELANAFGISVHEVRTTLEQAEAFVRQVFEEIPHHPGIREKLDPDSLPEELRVWLQFV